MYFLEAGMGELCCFVDFSSVISVFWLVHSLNEGIWGKQHHLVMRGGRGKDPEPSKYMYGSS